MKRPTLRHGDTGPFVEQVQQRLIAMGLRLDPKGVTGVFDDLTDQRVKQFQQLHGLDPDGRVGKLTWAQFDIEEAKRDPDAIDDTPEPSSDPPPAVEPQRPPFQPLLGNAARAAAFGAFKYKATPTAVNPEAIKYLDDWPDKNIVTVHVPQTARIPGFEHEGKTYGRGPRSGLLQVHRLVREPLVRLWQAWQDAGLLHLVISWDGLWAPRFIRGSQSVLSNHAWATAFDINARWNPLGSRGAPHGERGSVYELIPLATKHGFFNGLFFNRRPDPMHFEWTPAG